MKTFPLNVRSNSEGYFYVLQEGKTMQLIETKIPLFFNYIFGKHSFLRVQENTEHRVVPNMDLLLDR